MTQPPAEQPADSRLPQTITFYSPVQDAEQPKNEISIPVGKDYPPNDAGNAKRFLDICSGGVRYVPAEKQWYYFDGSRWIADTMCMVQQLASAALSFSYQAEADYLKEQGNYKALPQTEKQSLRAGNISSLQNCLNMAALSAAISPDKFDADPYWFHAKNGAINMKTYDVLLYHDKRQFFTRTAGASLTPEGLSKDAGSPQCPRWIQFVKECCGYDEELYNYLQRAAGYSILTGDIREQKVFCLLGAGRNGKSLFINTLARVAGDYAAKIEASVLCVNRFGDKDSEMSKELFRIRGSRFVYSNEFGRSSTLNENFVKTITDGGRIVCRTLYKESIEYTPTCTLWFSTNHMPALQAMDEGIRRRIVVIPFRNTLTEDAIDRGLPEKLLEEADAILCWLVQGYYRYTVHSLKPPAAVTQATACYFEEQDMYQVFLNEHYIPDTDGKVYAKSIYQTYQHWCAENGEKPVSSIRLGKELQRLGINRKKDMHGLFYYLQEKPHDEITESHDENMTTL